MTRTIAIIGGGRNAEHDVSLASAAAVADAVDRLGGWNVHRLTINGDGHWYLDGQPLGNTIASSLAEAVQLIGRSGVVFPAVHGPLGEDGTLASLCALTGVPVVGSAIGAGALGMDKWATKLVAEAVGIRTAPGTLVRASGITPLEVDEDVVVKPVTSGSSHGVHLARNDSELIAAIRAAAMFDDRILIEPVVHGREIDIAVIRDATGAVSTAAALEVHTNGLFDTATKYNGTARFTVPAAVDESITNELRRAAITMYNALGCDGVARMDFFLTEDGLVLNEVNTMPGLTPESQVPRMFHAIGISYDELIRRLITTPTEPNGTCPAMLTEGAVAR